MNETRFKKQMDFLIEIDKVKEIYRRTYLMSKSRRENDSEHSWHISLMAVVLYEYANDRDIDLPKVVKMLLIHDLVEIDAGDTFAYDEEGHKDKAERESAAALRVYHLLPDDQASEFLALWKEFESRETGEAKFANALDRFQPILHNYLTEGATWKEHGIKKNQVIVRNKPVQDGSSVIWDYIRTLIDDAVQKGYLTDG